MIVKLVRFIVMIYVSVTETFAEEYKAQVLERAIKIAKGTKYDWRTGKWEKVDER